MAKIPARYETNHLIMISGCFLPVMVKWRSKPPISIQVLGALLASPIYSRKCIRDEKRISSSVRDTELQHTRQFHPQSHTPPHFEEVLKFSTCVERRSSSGPRKSSTNLPISVDI